MNSDKFKTLLDELDGNSLNTLKEKNARYSQNGDCLHNFRSGAEVLGGTPGQACWGYMAKHLVALRDMVEKNDFSNREDFLEKCQDTINYIRFLWCIGNDEEKQCENTVDLDEFIECCGIEIIEKETSSVIYKNYSNPRIYVTTDFIYVVYVDDILYKRSVVKYPRKSYVARYETTNYVYETK